MAGAVTWALRAGWPLAVAGEELVAEGLDLPLDGGGVERGVLFGQPALGQGPHVKPGSTAVGVPGRRSLRSDGVSFDSRSVTRRWSTVKT